jgi:hypothetical protein
VKKYERVISIIKEESPLLKMIESGLTPEEIKEAIIKLLEPYFDNKDVLEQLAIEALVPESINLLKLQKDKWFFGMFEKCLATYRLAKSKDPQSCFKSCALWQPQILQSLSEYWSVLYLEVDKSNLEIEELLHECLGNIGDIIEGLIKPYLKTLLHQIMIANVIKTVLGDIDSLTLGTIVSELIQKSGYGDLFMPPPWNIKLNQWRDIAYHHSAKIENSEIICWYGKTPNIKEVKLSKRELLQVVQTAFNVYMAIRLAHTLFFIDNLKEINRYSPTVEVRDEAEFINFATGLESQGFEIIDFKKDSDEAKLVVKDVSNLDPDQRRFHASQFLFPLWLLTKAKHVVIEYREKENTPNLLVSVNSTVCEKIYNKELEPMTLANKMEMVDLKTNKVIPTIEMKN